MSLSRQEMSFAVSAQRLCQRHSLLQRNGGKSDCNQPWTMSIGNVLESNDRTKKMMGGKTKLSGVCRDHYVVALTAPITASFCP